MNPSNQDSPIQEPPKFFDNINDRVIDDLKVTIKKGSKVSIAAASLPIPLVLAKLFPRSVLLNTLIRAT